MEFYPVITCFKMLNKLSQANYRLLEEIKALTYSNNPETFNKVYQEVINVKEQYVRSWMIKLIDSLYVNFCLSGLNYNVCGNKSEKEVLQNFIKEK